MKYDINTKNGIWEVNGKKMNQLNPNELDFMNRFFREVKLGNVAPPKPVEIKLYEPLKN